EDALAATVLYATALGIDNREARELAGLPVPPTPVERSPVPRLLVIAGVVIALAVFTMLLLLVPRSGGKNSGSRPGAVLPPPWRRGATARNGRVHISYTR